jgi:uncharacterized membrane protein YfcA
MTVALFLVAVLGGATAAVAGFGIGSLLTPILALSVGTPLAVAAVSIPHAAATALRFWRLRTSVDRGVLLRFGLLSAAGGPMRAMAMPIAVMTVGTLTGTLLGERVLLGLTPERFRQLVSLLIGVLGAWFVVHTLG